MTPDEVVEIACAAERIGYDYCLVADEGLQADVFACLGVIAARTDRIGLGPVTNGYTRHPAVIASAIATLHSLSGGRAMVTLLAGGSMVLEPMGIERAQPYRVIADTIQVLRRLWTGDEITWEGNRYRLDRAQLAPSIAPAEIPIWVASRGPMILRLAGRHADGVLLTVKPDLGAARQIVAEGADQASRPAPRANYLGRVCYTPQMVDDQRVTLPYVLMDSPRRVLRALDLDDSQIALVSRAAERNDVGSVAPLVTDELLGRYQVTGSAAECSEQVAELTARHDLAGVFVDVLSTELDQNLELLEMTHRILTEAKAK